MIVSGGPPSVGSSLLVRILDRHPGISAGPETAIFARTTLMTHWNRDKHLLIGKHLRKLRDHGWHRYRGTTLVDDFYPWDRFSLSQMIIEAESYETFVSLLEERIHAEKSTTIWIEKTPSNAYNFGWLRKHVSETRFIMMIRNPYDAIASMISRGFSPLYATAAYLLHSSAGYLGEADDIHYLKYEDLVHNTTSTLIDLCNFVGVTYDESMIAGDTDNNKMPGWLQSETGKIGTQSINRFEALHSDIKEEVIQCVAHLSVNPNFNLPSLSWGHKNIEEICAHYNYKFLPSTSNSYKRKHQLEILREKAIRTATLYPTHFLNFPLRYRS